MINNTMKWYDYYRYNNNLNAYGQQTLSETCSGKVRMAISITSQSVQENINYKDATYLGLTYTNFLNDSYAIQYGDKKLKVLYVNTQGRLTQVFMAEI